MSRVTVGLLYQELSWYRNGETIKYINNQGSHTYGDFCCENLTHVYGFCINSAYKMANGGHYFYHNTSVKLAIFHNYSHVTRDE